MDCNKKNTYKKYKFNLSQKIYFICLILGICFVLACIYIHTNKIVIFNSDKECGVFKTLGIYCMGCGGTRAVYFLLHGKIIKSFVAHPAVIYTAILYVLYVTSHSLFFITKGKIKYMKFKNEYLLWLIVIMLVQCVFKNLLRIFIGFELPSVY